MMRTKREPSQSPWLRKLTRFIALASALGACEIGLSAQIGMLGEVLSVTDEHVDNAGRNLLSNQTVRQIGDLDQDGVCDLATDSNGSSNTVVISFMNPDGTVNRTATFGAAFGGGFPLPLQTLDQFGSAIECIGDLDGDGVDDLMVGAHFTDDQVRVTGAIYSVFMTPQGTVKDAVKIGRGFGGFCDVLRPCDTFGDSITSLGDLDGDGVVDIAVGAPGSDAGDDPFANEGSIWILFLKTDGTVKDCYEIQGDDPAFGAKIEDGSFMGRGVASLGDLDGDGFPEIAMGASEEISFLFSPGSVYIAFLQADGHPKKIQQLTDGVGGFSGDLDPFDRFGWSVTSLPDLDGDGVVELAVGAKEDDDGSTDQGAVWILFLNPDGTVHGQTKISATTGGFDSDLLFPGAAQFGFDVSGAADYDADGSADLFVTGYTNQPLSSSPDDGVWLLHLDDGLTGTSVPYGSGLNPDESLVSLTGRPVPGTTWTLGVDNPLGSQSVGSLPFGILSLSPDPAFPSGTPLPGFGMTGAGALGELLIDLGPTQVVEGFTGAPWQGTGLPAALDLVIPSDNTLLGLHLYFQGLLLDPSASQGVRLGLTEAREIRIGP